MTAPVTGSGDCPAWIARVPKPCPFVSATRGPRLPRPAVHLARAVGHAAPVVDDPELVPAAGVTGVERDDLVERLDRAVEPVELVVADAEVVPRPRPRRVE